MHNRHARDGRWRFGSSLGDGRSGEAGGFRGEADRDTEVCCTRARWRLVVLSSRAARWLAFSIQWLRI